MIYQIRYFFIIFVLLNGQYVYATPSLEQAQEVAFQAQLAAEQSNFEESIKLYREAYKLFPDQEFLFAVASLSRRLPDSCRQELQSWEEFFKICDDCPQKAKAQERSADVEKRCYASLTVECRPTSTVYLNGALQGSSPQVISKLKPGTYQVQCGQAENKVQKEITLGYQEIKKFDLTLSTKVSKPLLSHVNKSSSASTPKQNSTIQSGQFSPLEWGVMGGGATTLGIGLYFLLHQLPSKLEQRDALESQLVNSQLTDSTNRLSKVKDLDAEAQSAETWGLVSLGVSAALIGTSIYLLWPNLGSSTQVQLVPGSDPKVSLQWSW